MMRFAILVMLSFTLSGPANSQSRIALLIGNQGYTQKVGPLSNPHNDVRLLETALTSIGFNVTLVKDASYRDMDIAVKQHIEAVRRAGPGAISFFYYSGHGAANPDTQTNFLIPIDVADANNPGLWTRSFEHGDIVDKLSQKAPLATHYVIFDACRNELLLSGAGQKSLGAEKGFLPVKQTTGLLIAYATAPKQTASDAGAGGGPYAKVLAEEIVKPGIEAVTMFRTVQIRVKLTIGQDPWLSFPSLPEVYLAGRGPPASASVPQVQGWTAPLPPPRPAGPAPNHECDALAANPDDPARIGPGVKYATLNAASAVQACQRALQDYPTEKRFKYQLARSYQKASDPGLSLRLLEELVEQNYVAAFDNLAWLYWEGRGVPKDIERAIELYVKGSELGSGEAMNNLGMLYWNIKQFEQAETWFRKSATTGYEAGVRNLASIQRAKRNQANEAPTAQLPPEVQAAGIGLLKAILEKATSSIGGKDKQ